MTVRADQALVCDYENATLGIYQTVRILGE